MSDLDDYVSALDWLVLFAAVIALVFLVLTLRNPPTESPDATA